MDSLTEIHNELLQEREEESVPRPRKEEKSKKIYKFRNERQMWIQETADMLKVDFSTVLWKTINWPTAWIRDHYLQCKNPEVDNPAQRWWGLIKYQNEKAKKG